jgi:hypothetical protein
MNDKKIKDSLGLPDDIPMLDMNDENFAQQLEFEMWSTHSSSDYRNDRERPYNGQEHTDDGIRGMQMVEGLTMRDIKDCFIKALIESSASDKYLEADVFSKCWDFSTEPPTPTQFLIDNQNDPDFISTKVELGTWRVQDIDKLKPENINFHAVYQNLSCQIEKMMGIFPNVPKIETNEEL